MNAVSELLTREAGPLPVGGWVLLIGGAGVATVMVTRNRGPQTRTVVDQVPVPVGAIASPDYAPLILNPIVRMNIPGVNELVDALGGNTEAVKGNTGATVDNTKAVTGNTKATAELTKRLATPAPAPKAPAPAKAPAAPKAPAPTQSKKYTIKSGDTLSAIAKRFSGNANNWRTLYNYGSNKRKIDERAARSGKPAGGNWIFPGTIILLPQSWTK